MNRCDGCAHWSPFPVTKRARVHDGYGECKAADIYNPSGEYGVEPIGPGPLVIDMADDPYVSGRLITRPGFGCALWEAKDS